MADELKRVGFVFKEDGATDFIKTLRNVNTEISKNYTEFKKTQLLWDESTSKTEKLTFQIDNLNNAYELQKDKVTILKAQLTELEGAENQNVTAINKKRAELEKAELKVATYEKKIKELSNQLKTSGKDITELGEKISKAGNKIENAGKGLSVFSGATITALGLSAKAGIDFEDAFAGVKKTVDATDEQLDEMKQQIRDLAKVMPATTTEISAVAESAGQLGIKTEDIMSFTKVMLDLGNTTNLSADEAASSLAKFANVTKMSAENYSNLGATIVDLGNHFATTERDIVEMSTRLAATGELAGLSQAQILALATAMSSVGVEAEAGGSAMSKLLKKIQVAVETGSKDLDNFAKVAGMTGKDFKQAFEKDAVKALSAFIGGLNNTERNGKSAISVLDDMGITEVRLSNTILSLANASGLMTDAIDTANKAWEDNSALTTEANKRYETLKSQITVVLNKLQDIGITVGEKLMPHIQKIIEQIGKWADGFSKLDDETIDLILNIGGFIAVAGPVVTTIGKITSTVGGVTKAFGTFKTALEVSKGLTTSTSDSVNGLANVFNAIKSPIGLAVTAITATIGLIAIAAQNANKDTKEAFENIGSGATDFITGIDSATSYLSAFNDTIFASTEEQQELKENMNEIQMGITEICKTAAEERRSFTAQEIQRLDEYFTKLRELKDREIEIQQEISKAITQQAQSDSESFQGSLEEYKVRSQEWIKTAEEQKDSTVKLIEEGTIQEVALLNQRYSTEEERQSEAYKQEYARVMEQKQKKIDATNDEVAQVCEAYANGYLERSEQDNGWAAVLKKHNEELEKEENRHNDLLEEINNNETLSEYQKNWQIEEARQGHRRKLESVWRDIYEDMSEEQENELGSWLARLSYTEMYGGDISEENQEMVNRILESYNYMPSETQKAMKNAMQPMLDEMKEKEPSLFAKAWNIADGILSRLRHAFDIHSPSKKTKEIFKNVMKRNGERN